MVRLKFARMINKYNATHIYENISHQITPSKCLTEFMLRWPLYITVI